MVRVHAVRAQRRAPRVPVLRRTWIQDAVRRRDHRPRQFSRVREHEGTPPPAAAGQRARALRVRVVAAAADLSGRAGGRDVRRHGGRGIRSPGAPHRHRGEGRPRVVRDDDDAGADGAAAALLHARLPLRQAGSRRRPQLRRRRDGERRPAHVPRGAAAAGRARVARGAPRIGEHHRARAGAPVVRRPGHDGVVGRPVAERGVRDLDGRQESSTSSGR